MVLRSETDRDDASASGANRNGNDVPIPEPPIHPTLADILAWQTELLVHLVN